MKSLLPLLFCLFMFGYGESGSGVNKKTEQKNTIQNTGNENNKSGCAMCLPK